MTESTILIIFGATGDLVSKKIIPSIYNLYKDQRIGDNFHIIAIGRRDFNNGKYNEVIKESLDKLNEEISPDALENFYKRFEYFQADFEQIENMESLGKRVKEIETQNKIEANKLFYLAVPPENYQTLFMNLFNSNITKLDKDKSNWARIIVEKPFGNDFDSAQKLDELLGKLFAEEQIYRIDHYLGKQALQNILTFRFENILFEPLLNNKYVEKIEIRTIESLGVEKRGNFYDKVGALRDVGQNHLLQMLALITMEDPKDKKKIRDSRAAILEKLIPLSEQDVIKKTKRFQYEGYRDIENVKSDSRTETYFKVEAKLDTDRWSGVPIYLEAGKRFMNPLKEIIVHFKAINGNTANKVIFSLEPEEEIKIKFITNIAGVKDALEEKTFDFKFRQMEEKKQYVEEYTELFFDAVKGDQTQFVSSKEVSAMWKFVDSIIEGWSKDLVPLDSYKAGANLSDITNSFI